MMEASFVESVIKKNKMSVVTNQFWVWFKPNDDIALS